MLLAAKRETAEDKEARQQARPPDAPADAGEAPTAAASLVLLDPEPNKAAVGNPAPEPEAIAATPEDGKELPEESPRQSEPSPKSPPAGSPAEFSAFTAQKAKLPGGQFYAKDHFLPDKTEQGALETVRLTPFPPWWRYPGS